MEVNVHEAKTHLSRLLRRVAAGEEVTISRAGVPVAKMIAATAPSKSRPMGMDRGKIWMAEDFDEPEPGMEATFHGPITTDAAPVQKTTTARRKKT
ncbi:MAG: type II toxin-antitoxin system prevent-host-death family antitoxin [Terriglobales bacterium]